MRYVLEHVSEGAVLAVAMVWIEGARVCVVLVFRREVELIEPKRILAADLNAIHSGIVWVVVERDRVLKRGVLRPNVLKIARLQRKNTAKQGSPQMF
jgi:hypothetical protein